MMRITSLRYVKRTVRTLSSTYPKTIKALLDLTVPQIASYHAFRIKKNLLSKHETDTVLTLVLGILVAIPLEVRWH